jgi:enoyl-CoA hydratase/carnithine racemase
VGLARAKALIMLGEEFSAEQALGWGLMWKVVDDSALGAASRGTAQRLAGLDRDVVMRYKRVRVARPIPRSWRTEPSPMLIMRSG